jgi:hypothetical protein
MTRRLVRFAPFFFDQLDDQFGEGRTAEGAPSATDFILFELVTVRDKLAKISKAARYWFRLDSMFESL